jgi:hypothetical protein
MTDKKWLAMLLPSVIAGKVPDQPESRTIFLLRKPGCTAIVKIGRQGSVLLATVIYTGNLRRVWIGVNG